MPLCPLKCLHSRQFHPFRTFRKQVEKQAEGEGERGAARATSSPAMLVNHLISLRSLPSCQAAAQRWRWRWRFRQREPVSVEQQQQQQLRPVSIIISVAIRGADSRQAGRQHTHLVAVTYLQHTPPTSSFSTFSSSSTSVSRAISLENCDI